MSTEVSDQNHNRIIENGGSVKSSESEAELSWSQLAYGVGNKQILWPQSGHVKAGQAMALMGPSGAGKTTLLSCLSGRLRPQMGTVTIGSNLDHVQIAFVPQREALLPYFTVLETLLFASKLKNKGLDIDEHDARIRSLLKSFNLIESMKTKVSKLSGGQRRRLSICVEVIGQPNVLLLDEPTSGLDSTAAEECVQILSEQAKIKRITVISSIHQPSNDVLMAFDHLYLLNCRGQVIFKGAPISLLPYFSEHGLECPKKRSIGEFALDISAQTNSYQMLRSNTTVEPDPQIQSDLRQRSIITVIEENLRSNPNSAFKEIRLHSERLFSLWNFKSPLLLVRIFVTLALVILGLGLYTDKIGLETGCMTKFDRNNMTNDDIRAMFKSKSESLFNTVGYIAGILLFCMFTPPIVAAIEMKLEMPTVINEVSNRWYRSSSYFFGKCLADLAPFLIVTVVCFPFNYMLIGYPLEPLRMSVFAANVFLTSIIADAFGVLCGIIWDNNLANSLAGACGGLVAFGMTSGFFVSFKNLPTYIRPLAILSYGRYTFETFIIALFGFNRCEWQDTSASDIYFEAAFAATPIGIIQDAIRRDRISEPGNFNMTGLNSTSSFARLLNLNKEVVDQLYNSSVLYYRGITNRTSLTPPKPEDIEPSLILDRFDVSDDNIWFNISMLILIYLIFRMFTLIALVRKYK